LKWCVGSLHEDDIADDLRADVENRIGDLPVGPQEYWRLVAEAAVECVAYDLMRRAQTYGVTVTDDDG
jgi:hypothetical protein